MLDLLSILKEPKTKTLKLHGQSETTDRLDGRTGRQLVRRLGGQTPSENWGATRLLHHKLRGFPSDPNNKHKNKPKPLTPGACNGAHQTTSQPYEPNLEKQLGKGPKLV